MTSISVCMIVKNEEDILSRCLDSLTDIADEIIVVDTGSTDRTKEVAARFTNKIYDFEWCDDFAAARNYSLSFAQCEYIYVADADEVLDDENRRRFLQLKEAILPEVEVVEMAYANSHNFATTENFQVEYRPKLFRRQRTFQFADPIHEALRTDPVVYRSNVTIHHRPTQDHSGRDLTHFARLLKNNVPFSARMEMMYARELLAGGKLPDFEVAAPYFNRVRDDASRSVEAQRRAACVLTQGAALKKDSSILLDVAAPELVGNPPCEVCCALGRYYLNVEKPLQAADWYSAAMAGAAPELIASSAGSLPLRGLAACHEAVGNTELAREYFERADAWEAENLHMGY